MHRREALRAEVMAGAAPGERADGDARIGRPEGGGAGLGNADPAQPRHDGKGVDVAGLALVGAHAERRVALQMLDGLVALLMGQGQILHRHIVLQIDESLALGQVRDLPDRLDAMRIGGGRLIDTLRQHHAADALAMAGKGGRGGTGLESLTDRPRDVVAALQRTGAEMTGA